MEQVRILTEEIEEVYINSDKMVSNIANTMDKFDDNGQQKIHHVLQLFSNRLKDMHISMVNNIIGSCGDGEELPHHIISVLLCLLLGGNMDLVESSMVVGESLKTSIHSLVSKCVSNSESPFGQYKPYAGKIDT